MGTLKARVGGVWQTVGFSPTDRWNTAWGIVGLGTVTSGNPLKVTTSEGTITNNISMTMQTGRRYRIVVTARAVTANPGANVTMQVWLRSGGSHAYPNAVVTPVGNPNYTVLYYEWLFDGDGSARVWSVSLVGSAPVDVYSDSQSAFYVEDMGPTTLAPVAQPSTFGLEAARPATAGPGSHYFATDTQRDWMYDGTGWVVMAEPNQGYTPTLVNATLGNGAVAGWYKRGDGYLDWGAIFTLGTTSAVATGPRISLPPPLVYQSYPSGAHLGQVALADATGGISTANAYLVAGAAEPRRDGAQLTASVPFTWAVNDQMIFTGRLRMNTRYL